MVFRTLIGVRGGSLALASTGECVQSYWREHIILVRLAAVRSAGHTKANFAFITVFSPWCNHGFRVSLARLRPNVDTLWLRPYLNYCIMRLIC